MTFFLGVLVTWAIYALGGLGVGLLLRSLSMVTAASAVVTGASAYAFALAVTSAFPTAGSVLLAVALGALASGGLGYLSGAVAEEDFPLASFAVQAMFTALVIGATSVTRGSLGLAMIPDLAYATGAPGFAALATSLLAIAVLAVVAVDGSTLAAAGMIGVASHRMATSGGINISRVRLQLGAVAGACLGLSGVLLASQIGVVTPQAFSIEASISLLAIGLIAQRRLLTGTLIGAAAIAAFPQIARLIPVPTSWEGYGRDVVSGVVLIMAALSARRRP